MTQVWAIHFSASGKCYAALNGGTNKFDYPDGYPLPARSRRLALCSQTRGRYFNPEAAGITFCIVRLITDNTIIING